MSSMETRRADRKLALSLFALAVGILVVGIPMLLLPVVLNVAGQAAGSAVGVAVHRLVDDALKTEEAGTSGLVADGSSPPGSHITVEEPEPKQPVRRRARPDPNRQVIPPPGRRDRVSAPRADRGQDQVGRRDEVRRGDRQNRRPGRARRVRSPNRR